MLVRSAVLPNRYPENDDNEIAQQLNIDYNEKTFLRPFEHTHFGLCKTAEQFRKVLKDALSI
jgi:hypothetical protein